MGFLYGMIGQVKKNGKVVKCNPVFRKEADSYYTLTRNKNGEVTCTPIDIECYGQPLFLPAAKKKIDDGKKYFFIFQSSKSKQIFLTEILEHPELRVGIYNNREFCVLRCLKWAELTEEDMTISYLQQAGHCFR